MSNAADTPLLSVEGLTVRYGGLVALDQVSFDLPEGARTGLIGPNGAGKTTMIDSLAGATTPGAGSVRFRGTDITGAKPHVLARNGLVRTFQSVELFDDLTVAENAQVSADHPSMWRALIEPFKPLTTSVSGDVEWALDLCGLNDIRNLKPSEISHGRRKLAGLARALALRPTLVLIDEPAAGLDDAESEQFGAQLLRLREEGVSMLLIDHDMNLMSSVCDNLLVLDFGRIIATGPPEEALKDPTVVAAYLGDM
jgi:branched-chain amino acid transport system ATP-binding protein